MTKLYTACQRDTLVYNQVKSYNISLLVGQNKPLKAQEVMNDLERSIPMVTIRDYNLIFHIVNQECVTQKDQVYVT